MEIVRVSGGARDGERANALGFDGNYIVLILQHRLRSTGIAGARRPRGFA